ncbi:hypothetical protein T484DRAFT_1854160 [Baffinella frigidus]|nr:hypothetical protein T484DRAFT_1854160 [Cryptophyta sp. CCMP2293]
MSSPGDIKVNELGDIKLCDFGLARLKSTAYVETDRAAFGWDKLGESKLCDLGLARLKSTLEAYVETVSPKPEI